METLVIAAGIIILVAVILYVGNASMTRRHNAGGGGHADFVGVAETVPQGPTEKAIPGKLLVDVDGFTFTASPGWNHVRGVTKSSPPYERRTANQMERNLLPAAPTYPEQAPPRICRS